MVKIGPETRFFAIFSSLVNQFSLKLHSMKACNNVQHGDKIHEKIGGTQIWSKVAKIGPETRFFSHFLKFGSLVFLEIAYNHSLQQCLTYRNKIHKKNFGDPNLSQRGQNRSRNQVFCHFLKLGSLVFLVIIYNNSLEQCLTCSRGKTYEKKIRRLRFELKGPKSVSKLGFLSFSEF